MSQNNGLWPPCFSKSRDKIFPQIKVSYASGGWLYTETDRIFDATSSWWCKHLGHRHPAIMQAMQIQAEQYIHAIGANTYSTAIQTLSNKLTSLYPNLDKVSYASDGSCAVEIALKLAMHTRKLMYPNDKRRKIIKLSGAYHGETALALSVSDCDMYKVHYQELLLATHTCHINSNCTGITDPSWHDAEAAWQQILPALELQAKNSAILIIEPILQAANNMQFYSADLMQRLCAWARANNIDVIADEIMTGFWRTGRFMAMDHIDFVPDFICLGKGLTAGSIPMSAVLTSSQRFAACYPEDGTEQAFLHSHTYSAHALAAATACAAISVYQEPEIAANVAALEPMLLTCFQNLPKLKNIRGLGCVAAAELDPKYFPVMPSPAQLQKLAAEHGVLIRPLGTTIYLCPPINTSKTEVDAIQLALAKTLDLV